MSNSSEKDPESHQPPEDHEPNPDQKPQDKLPDTPSAFVTAEQLLDFASTVKANGDSPEPLDESDRILIEQLEDELDEKAKLVDGDARKDPVVSAIMFLIGAVGLLLLALSGILKYANDANNGIVWTFTCLPFTWEPSIKLNRGTDFLFGLGAELTVSSILAYFFIHMYSDSTPIRKLRLLQGVLGVTAFVAMASMWLKSTFLSATIESVCIEIIGGMFVFVVLDNVADALQKTREEKN